MCRDYNRYDPLAKVRTTQVVKGDATKYSDHSRLELSYQLTSQHKEVVPHGKRWGAKYWDFYWDAPSHMLASA